jgi:integrase
VDRGDIKIGWFGNIQKRLAKLVEFYGADTPIEELGRADRLDDYLNWLSRGVVEGKWGKYFAGFTADTSRTFIEWAYNRDLCPQPKNLRERFSFRPPLAAPRTWPVEDFKKAVAEAPEFWRLCLLLMANIGGTQVDVAKLRRDEVDLDKGRITRKRTKRDHDPNAPVTSYPLWPTTLALLKKFIQHDGKLALLTPKGAPLLVEKFKPDGKSVTTTDSTKRWWFEFRKKLGMQGRQLKGLRKLGATLLDGHPVYERFGEHFLAHSPKKLKDRHYIAESAARQALFDEAVAWLGLQLGQVTDA